MDNVSSALGAGAGIVVVTLEGIKLEHSFRLGFKASNNEAEYKALIAELRVVSDLGAREIEVYSDSRLMVNQVQGRFEAKDPRMMEYLQLVKQTMDHFLNVKVIQVARGHNRHADSLAILASSSIEEIPQLIKVELVAEPSISAGVGVSLMAMVEPCWMDPIINFLVWIECRLMRRKQKKYAGQLLGIRCLPIISYIEDLLTGLTHSACTLARLRNS